MKDIETNLLEILRSVSGTPLSDQEIKTVHLIHYGVLDSLTAIHFIIELEDCFGIKIEAETDDPKIEFFKDVLEFVEKKRAGAGNP